MVFLLTVGYDFGGQENIIVSYIHSKGLVCFVNSWFIDDSFGNDKIPFQNENGIKTKLKKDDWYLLESFFHNSSSYYSEEQFISKCQKAQKYKKDLKIKVAALTYKFDNQDWNTVKSDIEISYILALLMGFDAWWYTDKLEDDSLNHGTPPNYDFGNKLLVPLRYYKNKYYISSTNKYSILFDFSNYPDIKFKTFKYSLYLIYQ